MCENIETSSSAATQKSYPRKPMCTCKLPYVDQNNFKTAERNSAKFRQYTNTYAGNAHTKTHCSALIHVKVQRE